MHKFLIKDGVGFTRDFGPGSPRAAKLAKREIGEDAVIALFEQDSYWMRPADVEYFSKLIGPMKVVSSATEILERKEEQEANTAKARLDRAVEASTDKRKARHPKFGEGVVIGEDARAYTIAFPGQAKSLRVIKDAVEIVS